MSEAYSFGKNLLLAIFFLLATHAAGQPVTVVSYDADGRVLHQVDGDLIHPPMTIKHQPQPPQLLVRWQPIRGAVRVEIFMAPHLPDIKPLTVKIPISFTNVSYDPRTDIAVIFVTLPVGGAHYRPCSAIQASSGESSVWSCTLEAGNMDPALEHGRTPR
jgi:hypothetical protein